MMNEFAPGRNRGIYLVGHLVAYHDMLSEILGTGKRNYPEMELQFLRTPDKSSLQNTSITELRQRWAAVHERLRNEFEALPADAWLARHESMTDDDFEKDSLRNKLSVLLSRTNHIAYHFGQMRLLK